MVEVHNYQMTPPFVMAFIWRTALLRGRLNLEVRLYWTWLLNASLAFYLGFSVDLFKDDASRPLLMGAKNPADTSPK